MISEMSSGEIILDPRRLLTFREVARHRSFSRAATALALTQPAVSQQIRALETQLDAQLIQRRRGLFILTPAGELLLAHAEALAERLQLAETQLLEALAPARTHLRLGAFPSSLARLVPSAVQRVRSSNVDIELTVTEGSTNDLVAQLRDGGLHLALCFQDAAGERREHVGTRRYELFREPMVAVLPPKHRLARRARIRLGELSGETWLAANRDGLIYRACVAAGFEPRIAYLTADPLGSRGLVAAGLAVTLTSKLLAPDLPGVATPVLEKPPRRVVYALTPNPGSHSLVEPFLAALRSEARQLGLSVDGAGGKPAKRRSRDSTE
jgi:DNA-binding transcriptional LysR family regulator